ncbi:hypothetical protein COBT_004259, partial [Conglomerata obtusa]
MGKEMVITSSCPGTVAYIERKAEHLINNLAKIKSPQQLGIEWINEQFEINTFYFEDNHIDNNESSNVLRRHLKKDVINENYIKDTNICENILRKNTSNNDSKNILSVVTCYDKKLEINSDTKKGDLN